MSYNFIENEVTFLFIFLNTLALFLLVGRNATFTPLKVMKLYSHLKITFCSTQIQLPVTSAMSTMANISKWVLYSADLTQLHFLDIC